MVLEGADGRPLWDGTTELHVRGAMPEEAEAFDMGFTKAVLANEVGEDERERYLVFLFSVSDPTDDPE